MDFVKDKIKIPSSEKDVHLDVWHYKPTTPEPHPLVVAGHGMTVIKDAGMSSFGEHWARLGGFASLIFDYRYFGDSDGQPRDFLSLEKQLEDYRCVIQWARAQQDMFRVDKIVPMGSAASGHTVAKLLLEDAELAGGMAHCPLLDGYTTMLSQKFNARLVFWATVDYICGMLGISPVFVQAVGHVGEFAMLNTPSSWSGFEFMFSQGETAFSEAPNRVPAGLLFEIMGSRAGLKLKHAHSRFLVVVPEDDDIFPVHIGQKIASEAPEKVILVEAPGGHFDIMSGGKGFQVNINAQIKFLQSVLLE
ncbi:alpha/beta-hydrolase [Gymnopus androsaceus JB14]|uniref:Alpha/beta-hydrolase n=1 Tax=Gymnopus androsaceus JB14 TaxID=1447944 RepID=A0A6A4H3N7_9AGAR|nr:alpha/beta-hydrolase [Gymnopus androsaceus JB14]